MSTANKTFVVAIVAALILAFVGGLWYLQQPKTVIDTDTLLVTREGAIVRAKRAEQERRYRARRKAQHAEFIEHFKRLWDAEHSAERTKNESCNRTEKHH